MLEYENLAPFPWHLIPRFSAWCSNSRCGSRYYQQLHCAWWLYHRSWETWPKDRIVYDIQETKQGPGQSYVFQCPRPHTHIGEYRINDMLGDFFVACLYYVVYLVSTGPYRCEVVLSTVLIQYISFFIHHTTLRRSFHFFHLLCFDAVKEKMPQHSRSLT